MYENVSLKFHIPYLKNKYRKPKSNVEYIVHTYMKSTEKIKRWGYMLLEEVMQQLEEYGTEQNRKTYKTTERKSHYSELVLHLKLLKKKIKKIMI